MRCTVTPAGNPGVPGYLQLPHQRRGAGVWGGNGPRPGAAATSEVNGLSIALLGDGITGNETWPNALGVVPDAGSQATANRGGTNPLNLDQVTADIERLAGQYDIVIPFFHMSEQYF